MIGGPYSASRRQRRSFRKYYVALFIACAFLLWQSSKLSGARLSGTSYESQPPVDEVLARASGEEAADSQDAYDEGIGSYEHTSRRQSQAHQAQQAQQDAESEPETEVEASAAKAEVEEPASKEGPADAPKGRPDSRKPSAHEEPSEEHDTDTIDSIKDSHGDQVDHETKLRHPEDDDAETDSDKPSFKNDGMVRLEGDSQKKMHENVDKLLEADHPSKDLKNQPNGDEADEDDSLGEGPKVAPPIVALDEMTPWGAEYKFPAWEECETLKDRADEMPDMIIVPFEEAVKDVVLEGWEDEWIAKARFTGPKLQEPKIDFVYNWVNGSQPEFQQSMRPYELNSTLNDEEGTWIASHSTNRYREWNELRYSLRSVEKYASQFTNRIQILVNAFHNIHEDDSEPAAAGKQRPHWLRDDNDKVQVLSQEEFFGPEERKCLPTFDSLTIENQLYNTKSETDRLFALSDDMILGRPHAAADLYSPLFGPTMGFKDNAYNTLKPPTEEDAERFGEKPFLIYTSWLLNRRFGARKRKGQVHFGHSLGRSVTKEAITSFPRPALRSAMQRFRGETGFQLYSWFAIFHYTMERHREALLWSYIMLRSDADDDGYLSWDERKKILQELGQGMSNETPEQFRHRIYYRVGEHQEQAGLQAPQVNTDVLWTSMDGPIMIKDLDCDAFDTEDCLAPGFSMPSSDSYSRSPVFSSAAIFDRISRQSPRCGDCLLKLILNRRRAGLGPLLPDKAKKPEQRETVIKALMRYAYSIVKPDADFHMVTDAEQAEQALLKPYIKKGRKVGQICLNDDVVTADVAELDHLGKVMSALFEGLLPDPSSFEK